MAQGNIKDRTLQVPTTSSWTQVHYYGGRFVSLLFNQKKGCFNQKIYFQSKKPVSIKEKKCLNAKIYLRLKKMHLNTIFFCLKMFFLIEVKVFLFEATFLIEVLLFCVWAILWVGHLCLYNSIKKEVASNKQKIFSIKKSLQSKNKPFQS